MSNMNILPAAVNELIVKKHFDVIDIIRNDKAVIIKGTTPQYDFPVILKVIDNSEGRLLRQSNHILWMKSLSKLVAKKSAFHIPPILEDGLDSQSWRWFIMPYITGTSFAELDANGLSHILIDNPAQVIPDIIKLLKFIESTPAQSALGVDARLGRISRKNRHELLENAVAWARNDTPYLADLLQIIKANGDFLQTQNAHGDFTETNLIIGTDHKPVLIDAEISSAYHYRYYDVVEFHNRLFTRADEPELAALFLKKYAETVPKVSRQKFFNNLLCLAALRCLGNFIEISPLPEPGKEKRLQLATNYAKEIVTYGFLNEIS